MRLTQKGNNSSTLLELVSLKSTELNLRRKSVNRSIIPTIKLGLECKLPTTLQSNYGLVISLV